MIIARDYRAVTINNRVIPKYIATILYFDGSAPIIGLEAMVLFISWHQAGF
jgi:hypothetical protein